MFHNVNQADTLADLKTLVAANGQIMILWSNTTVGDIHPYWYIYDTSSSATESFPDVVKPTVVMGNGRYLRTDLSQVQPDWTEGNTAALAYIKNKPTIPAAQVNSDWNSGSGLSQVLNKPTIPAAQVNSDWNAGSGLAQILNKPTVPSVVRTTSTQSLSLVGTGATGTQISSTKDATIRLTVQTSATATIAGAATSTITLKKCATNDAAEGNWTTVSVSETSQSYSLAVALQGVTGGKAQLVTDLPAGWFVKLVNTGSGTHAETFLFGEKTIYG